MRKRLHIFRSKEENNFVCPNSWRYPKSKNQNQTNKSLSFRATITKKQLLEAYKKLGQWQKVAIHFGVTHSYIIKARKWLNIFQPTKTRGYNYGGVNSKFYLGKYADNRGYIIVNRYHPDNTKDYNTYEHVLIMEAHMGRSLELDEQIHHVDGDKSNNHIDNLALCNSVSHRHIERQLQEIGYGLVKNGLITFDHASNSYKLKKNSNTQKERTINFKALEEMIVVSVPDARPALFKNKELVAHSRSSMRQVTFQFISDETLILVVLIDEHMKRSERTCAVDDTHTISEIIKWLNGG
ncbi:hypothetical protein LCGC14_0426710 [marine sediment metagenome]|uniref:HNH nuclease domain-containing protein n=1 Tax=marine sediment metagenome TaxID=412755 RepID=A0A0F9SPC7_9ZZZZ